MKELLKVLVSTAFVLLLCVQESYGTHIRAAEIRVRRISNTGLTYEITVIGYRDTGSDIRFGGGVLFIGGQEIEGFEVDTKIDLGNEVEFNSFSLEFTFQGPGLFTIEYREENRNEGILNMFNSVETPFYVETQIRIDPIAGLNNSVLLTAPPVDRGAVGSRFIHNPAAFDPDGDSLAYVMTIPKQSRDSLVIDYVDPNDPKFYQDFARGDEEQGKPPEFFIVNQNDHEEFDKGDLIWNAPGQEGEYNVAFIVEEWKKIGEEWIQMGFVVRDMQIIIEDSDNERPDIFPPPDLCVVAGTKIEEIIEASDPDGHPVKIEAFGGPIDALSSPAIVSPSPATFQSTPGFLTFQWQTNCDHVRAEPYTISFKVTDGPPQNEGPSLAEQKAWNIQVVAPPPTGLTTTLLPGEAIQLNWDDYTCGNATNMQIWRRVDDFAIAADSCVTGMPGNAGYELIDVIDVDSISYVDTNFGEGLAPGAKYCYRIVAEFALPTGGESFVSEESCSLMLADAPIITNVSIQNTGESDGQVLVKWMEPFEIDKALFPPPYQYEVFRSEGFTMETAQVSLGITSDTLLVDTGLNTLSNIYNYQVVLIDASNQQVDTSAVASTVRLEPTPLVEAVELTWDAEVPWSNNVQDFPFHFVFRNNVDSSNPDALIQIAAVDVNVDGFFFMDDGSHNGETLDDEITYCYLVTTQGSYGNPAIDAPLLNNSQVSCTQPNDEVPPCTPVSFQVDESFGCEQFLVDQVCEFSDFQNRLIWEEDDATECEDDVRSYNIYFSETGDEDSFELISTVDDTEFTHSNLRSFKGCYKISAVDRSGNESELSEMLCNDNCPFYSLPNVFTPNNDGQNDVFKPFTTTDSNRENFDRSQCPRFVEAVKLQVFDRYGNQVFDYNSDTDVENSVLINWTGQKNNGSELPSGVYYYVADVTFDVLDPANVEQQITGWVHLLR